MVIRMTLFLSFLWVATTLAGEKQIMVIDYGRAKSVGWIDDGTWMNLSTKINLSEDCAEIGVQGGGQIYYPLPRLESGSVYVVMVQMQTDGQIENLSFGLRKIEGPWTEYGRKTVKLALGNKQTFCMEIRMKDSTAPGEVGLFGYMRGTGTIRIASLSVAEASGFSSIEPENNIEKHLLLNSDFRLMDSGWNRSKAKWSAGAITFPGSIQYLESIQLQYGVQYALTLAGAEGASVNYRIYRPGKWGETAAEGKAILRNGEFSTTFRLEPPVYGVLADDLSYNVWIGSESPAVLTKCAIVCGTPQTPALCGFRFSNDIRQRESNIRSGEKFVVDFATTGIPTNTAVDICVRDHAMKTLISIPTTIQAMPNGLLGNQVQLTIKQTGWFTLSLCQIGETVTGFPAEFVVLPENRSSHEYSDFLLGAHLRFDRENTALADDSSLRLKQALDWGISGVRMHPPLSTKWWMVEPEQGKFVFHDEVVDEPGKFNISVLGLLDGTARFASTAPPDVLQSEDAWLGWGAYPPKNIADWENYVYRMVKHFKGRIHCWEVWNEPDHIFLRLPPSEHSRKAAVYLRLLQSAWNAAKRADPNCVIVAGSVTAGGKSFLLECIEMGMLNYCDAVSFHGYGRDQAAATKGAAAFDIAVELQIKMKEHNLIKPIWDSESGPGDIAEGYAGVPFSENVIKGIVARRAAGISRFYIYNGFTKDYPGHRDCRALLGYGRRPLALQGFLPVYDHFLGNAVYCAAHGSSSIHLYEFKTPKGGRIYVGWRNPGETEFFKLPNELRVSGFDLAGRLIGEYAGDVPLSEHLRYFLPAASEEAHAPVVMTSELSMNFLCED